MKNEQIILIRRKENKNFSGIASVQNENLCGHIIN